MTSYYVPSTKRELVEMIKRYYYLKGQTVSGLERKPVKQLYAIFHSIRRGHETQTRNYPAA